MRDRRELRSSVEKILAQKILTQKTRPKIQTNRGGRFGHPMSPRPLEHRLS
jgi:hypothetical protein